jgi:hypothetical protein
LPVLPAGSVSLLSTADLLCVAGAVLCGASGVIICRITLSCSRPAARVRDLWCSSVSGSLREDVVVGEIVIKEFLPQKRFKDLKKEEGGNDMHGQQREEKQRKQQQQ